MNIDIEIQRDLNRIMEILDLHDEIYRPKIIVSYIDRDSDQKRCMHYDSDNDIFRNSISARKYKDIISQEIKK